ncbi:transcriptional regulator PpsR [Roseivivax isoporae]|nr:transcriptional regulator PpsR [Roseivivax isoporae]
MTSNSPDMREDGNETPHDGGLGVVGEVLAASADLSVMLSPDGTVTSVVPGRGIDAFAGLDAWVGRKIEDLLTSESVPKLRRALGTLERGEAGARPVELNHVDGEAWEFPVRYTLLRYGADGSVLMAGRDLRAVAETQSRLVQAQMSLEQGYEARREFDTRYRLLLRTVSDAVVFLSASDGRVVDLNEPAAALLGGTRDALGGKPLSRALKDSERGDLIEMLTSAAVTEDGTPVEVVSLAGDRRLTLRPQLFRAGGERFVIARILSADGADAQDDSLGTNLAQLYAKGTDAMIFTSIKGEILSCNDAFLELIDAAHLSGVKGQSIASYLARGQIDVNVIVDHARRSGHLRAYSTQIVNDLGAETPVELSAIYLNDRTHPELGFILRDTSRSEALRSSTGGIRGGDESSRGVMELVGSATLKEIVAETTEVVEKMCIETAVHLTRNNRVAAAEMLGLSRQSLYVKLRKYGLLARDTDTDSDD